MEKLIALSFDDGPNMTTTKEMLDVLEKHGVVGSFFVIGRNINEETKEMMRRAVALGCEIENHSFTHDMLGEKTPEELEYEISETTRLIEETVGRTPQFFRPPYINVSDTMWDNISLPFICGYGVDDWVPTVPAKEREDRIVADAKHGAIVLLHDLYGNTPTVEAVDAAIPRLKEQGYRFVTVAQLFELTGTKPQPRQMYTYLL